MRKTVFKIVEYDPHRVPRQKKKRLADPLQIERPLQPIDPPTQVSLTYQHVQSPDPASPRTVRESRAVHFADTATEELPSSAKTECLSCLRGEDVCVQKRHLQNGAVFDHFVYYS